VTLGQVTSSDVFAHTEHLKGTQPQTQGNLKV